METIPGCFEGGEITEMEILHDQWLTNNLALEVY